MPTLAVGLRITRAYHYAARVRWRLSWFVAACRRPRLPSRASATLVRWCPRRPACASRRTAAWKSYCANSTVACLFQMGR